MNLNGASPETLGALYIDTFTDKGKLLCQVCLWNREKNVIQFINEVNSIKESYIINVSNRHY